MTAVSNDGRFTRRQVARTELYAGHPASDRPQIDAVLEAFADRRLIVLNRDTAELAHEALITAWPRLRAWLEDDWESLHIYSRLAEDAHNWADSNADPWLLYRGTRLAVLREANKRWTADPGRFPAPSTLQREFIRASSRAAARSARQRRIIGTIIVLLVITSVVSAFLAFTARR
jgi:hypothetical protein